VPLSIWYDWKNDCPDPRDREQNFGTVMPDLTPKPAYVAVWVFSRELAGFRLLARLDTGREEDFVLALSDAAGRTKLAAWTTAEPHAVMIEMGPGPQSSVAVTEMSGRKSEAIVRSQGLILDLDPEPRYVDLGRAAPKK